MDEKFHLSLTEVKVLAGTNLLDEGGVKEDVIEIIIHEKYSFMHHNVALLKLKNDLPLSESIKVIKLFTQQIPVGNYVMIAGWGKTNNSAPFSNRLKYHIMIRISWTDCFNSMNASIAGMFCLGHSTNNGACFVSCFLNS